MYGLDTFQIPNAINRFVVHDRDGLKYNADGLLDILIKPERPADESMFNNWLPAPSSGLFTLQTRLYTPHRKVLDGLWTMPAVKRVP